MRTKYTNLATTQTVFYILPGQVESCQENEDHIHSRVSQHHQMKKGRSIPGQK